MRGVDTVAGLELIPVWTEELLVGLPVSHPLAAREKVELADLAGVPLRVAAVDRNPPLRRLLENACAAAGFTPSIIEMATGLQDVLAVIGAAPATWSVFYASQVARQRSATVTFRSVLPPLMMPTHLAVRESARSGAH
ncbi:MAG: LysR substrate-binding domain-containing protein [Nakamurella sp.]